MMGVFEEEENHLENQIEIYQELLEEKQKEFDALEDVKDSPQAEARRQQLFEEITQIKLSIEQAKENSERSDEQEQSQDGMDLFED